MDDIKGRIASRKAELDALRPLTPDLLPSVREHYDVELTYTSNAIEGNTLTLRETAEVIQHGFTVAGKKLSDHLEAEDHYQAIQWMRAQADTRQPLSEDTVTELHRRVVLRSHPEIAGVYSTLPRRIAGSSVVFPNPAKIPALMASLGRDLADAGSAPETAFDAHYRLVAIHPFGDGNGRTARLLMNLMLLRDGYPLVAVRPEDRPEYLASLEEASITEDTSRFQRLLHLRLAETLDAYVELFHEAEAGAQAALALELERRRDRGR